MDNNQTWQIESKNDEMENWKKKILMDPVLNTLFDESVTAQQFLNDKILTLPKSQIPSLYSKLTTINFELIQNLQKEVENKNNLIEKSFTQLVSYKQQLEGQDDTELQSSKNNKPTQYLTHLKSFNKKYETVQQSVMLWKNITECLHFSKAFQNFKVNVNIMKTMMRGFNGNQDSINCIKIAKMLKDLIKISTKYDFSGIKSFQNQRIFISSTKSIVYSKGCKILPILLQQQFNNALQSEKSQRQSFEKNIEDWLNALSNIGMLKDFVVSFGKYMLNQQSQSIKKNMKNDWVHIQTNIQNILVPFLTQSCRSLIFLQQKLIMLRKIELNTIPNLFTRYWQKLCENMRQNIGWAKKEQQKLKQKTKQKEDQFVWKYPAIYHALTKLCSNIQIFLLQTVVYNSYIFAKCKERLMVGCLIELSVQYHGEVDRELSAIAMLLAQPVQQLSQSSSQVPESPTLSTARKCLEKIEHIFSQCKNEIIFNHLVHVICSKINQLNQAVKIENYTQTEVEKRNQHVSVCNYVKKQVKNWISKYGSNFGISLTDLQAFLVVH